MTVRINCLKRVIWRVQYGILIVDITKITAGLQSYLLLTSLFFSSSLLLFFSSSLLLSSIAGSGAGYRAIGLSGFPQRQRPRGSQFSRPYCRKLHFRVPLFARQFVHRTRFPELPKRKRCPRHAMAMSTSSYYPLQIDPGTYVDVHMW